MCNSVILLLSHLSKGMLCVHFHENGIKVRQAAAVGLAWLQVVCEKRRSERDYEMEMLGARKIHLRLSVNDSEETAKINIRTGI